MERKTKKPKNLAEKVNQKNVKQRHHTQFYYSFLTIILLICFVQMSFSALLNVTKVISYNRKISTLKSKQIAAEVRNDKLKKDLKNFSTRESMEAIARNNLKMAGDKEYLVIVTKPEEEGNTQPKKHKNWKKK